MLIWYPVTHSVLNIKLKNVNSSYREEIKYKFILNEGEKIMSFKKRVTKSIALALVGVTIAIPMLNTASAMENSKETYSQKIERVSKSFEDFVYLEDNQYKLDISVSELSESSKSDFYIYNDYINLLNNIIVSNNIKM